MGSASNGKCDFIARRCVCASNMAIITSIGISKRQSTQGCLHDRHRLRRLEDEQTDDALGPGRADFRKAGDDDITWPWLVTVPVLAIADAIFDNPERRARKHMFPFFDRPWWSGLSLANNV